MLRYVSRRIKDSVERTYNVLEVRRTWTLGNEGFGAHDGNQQQSSKQFDQNNSFQLHLHQRAPIVIFEFGFGPKTANDANVKDVQIGRKNVSKFQRKQAATSNTSSSSDGSSSDQEDFRERIHRKHHCKFQKNVVDALTWSSALICGWYTSQILCMRRRQLQNGWTGRCKYAKMLMQPSQAFHTAILSHRAKAAPEPQPETYIWKFNENHYKFHEGEQTKKFVYEVNNDHLKNDKKISADTKEIAPKTIDDAVHNLLQVLGDIEFQLGVQSVQSDRYDLAVSHFKLATSHSHASATYNLGICYEQGIGVEKNLKMALECYIVASSFGHAKALYNVGVFHAHGLANLPKNRKAARQYFKEAAKLGLNEANRALGMPLSERIEQPYSGGEQKTSLKSVQYQSQPVAVA